MTTDKPAQADDAKGAEPSGRDASSAGLNPLFRRNEAAAHNDGSGPTTKLQRLTPEQIRMTEEAAAAYDLNSKTWNAPTLPPGAAPSAVDVRVTGSTAAAARASSAQPEGAAFAAATGTVAKAIVLAGAMSDAIGDDTEPETEVDVSSPRANKQSLPRAAQRGDRPRDAKRSRLRPIEPRRLDPKRPLSKQTQPAARPPALPADEAPTDSFPAVRVTTDPRQVAMERTASVPAMPAMPDDFGRDTLDAVVPHAPTGKFRALTKPDSGMHSAPAGRAEALRPVQALIPWTPADVAIADAMQRAVLTPAAEDLSHSFFATLRTVPLASIFLGQAKDQRRLVAMLAGFLRTYTVDAFSDPWVEARIRMAHAHARVGIPLALYLASCSCLEGMIAARIDQSPLADKAAARDVLRRLLATESALVSQTFHTAQVDALNDAMREQAQSGYLRRYGAQVDPVTLLARPGHLRKQLDAALLRSHGADRGCALVALQLRGLDEAAFHRGYSYRDAILAESGARVRATLRGADVAGIEPDGCILALLNGVRANQVSIVASRLRVAIEDVAFVIDGHTFRQGVDLGVALPSKADDAAAVVAQARGDLPPPPKGPRSANSRSVES